ncbi:hypothetical protein ZWY2020_026810 [Hordeum vulgare]|nr:hypothetical protein ZWY2020_026810 [Hordeum vulgare]
MHTERVARIRIQIQIQIQTQKLCKPRLNPNSGSVINGKGLKGEMRTETGQVAEGPDGLVGDTDAAVSGGERAGLVPGRPPGCCSAMELCFKKSQVATSSFSMRFTQSFSICAEEWECGNEEGVVSWGLG